MLRVNLRSDRFVAGRFAVRLERTLRVPSDGKSCPLPPTFGAFPIYRFEDYVSRLPRDWLGRASYFVPLYQWEALWLSFEAAAWKPNAVQVASGGVNALTTEAFPSRLRSDPQNYVVCPHQPWLDGFKTGPGVVRQFVGAPLGQRLTIEEQIKGVSRKGGLQLRVIEPLPGIFPNRRPKGFDSMALYQETLPGAELGLAAGGEIEQRVYPDPHGVKIWDRNNCVDIEILIVNSMMFREITGQTPPPTPVSAADYTRAGLPWFRLYDEELRDIAPVRAWTGLKPLRFPHEPDSPKIVRAIRRKRPRGRSKT